MASEVRVILQESDGSRLDYFVRATVLEPLLDHKLLELQDYLDNVEGAQAVAITGMRAGINTLSPLIRTIINWVLKAQNKPLIEKKPRDEDGMMWAAHVILPLVLEDLYADTWVIEASQSGEIVNIMPEAKEGDNEAA